MVEAYPNRKSLNFDYCVYSCLSELKLSLRVAKFIANFHRKKYLYPKDTFFKSAVISYIHDAKGKLISIYILLLHHLM